VKRRPLNVILATSIIPILTGCASPQPSPPTQQDKLVVQMMSRLMSLDIACTSYRAQTGHWPTSLADLPIVKSSDWALTAPAPLSDLFCDPRHFTNIRFAVLPDGDLSAKWMYADGLAPHQEMSAVFLLPTTQPSTTTPSIR
jgi:hypothetical protein